MIEFHTPPERRQSVVLCFQLSEHLDLGDTKAAEIAGMMGGRSDNGPR